MLHLLGALLIFSGACWMGWTAAQELTEKSGNLQELIRVLEQLRQELAFRLTPLPQLLISVGEGTEGPVGEFFVNCGRCAKAGDGMFAADWKREAAALGNHMDPRVVDSLAYLGNGIGRYDQREQERLICAVIRELEGYLQEDLPESRRCGRLYQTLGASFGALLIILLF